MGANASNLQLQDNSLYEAVRRDDLRAIQAVLDGVARIWHGPGATSLAKLFAWMDDMGRTPLLLAAAHGFCAAAALLLLHGAEVAYYNNVGRGNALHEAAHNRHEHVVKLLLEQRDTVSSVIFLANKDGKTPLDLAEKVGHLEIVRMLQRCALYIGPLYLKREGMFFFSSPEFEARWVVTMLRFPTPNGPEPLLRKEMWVYETLDSSTPEFTVSLDGASVTPHDGTVTVRLHERYPKPGGGAFSDYFHGYHLYFRPVSEDVPMLAAMLRHSTFN